MNIIWWFFFWKSAKCYLFWITHPTRLLGALSKRENYSTLTYDLAVPKKMLPLSKCLIIWLCWGKIMPNRWPKYNVSYFQVLVCIHLDSILRRYCGIPAKSQWFNFKFVYDYISDFWIMHPTLDPTALVGYVIQKRFVISSITCCKIMTAMLKWWCSIVEVE